MINTGRASRCNRIKTIYSNCVVIDHQGDVIFRCSEDRANWYVRRDLAEVICDDPLTIKLKFVAGGKGNAGDAFYCGEKENKCVVCGENDLMELTKHHVVPYWLRRHLPVDYSNHTSHDILPVCRKCHDVYETHVQLIAKNMLGSDSDICSKLERKRYLSKIFGMAGVLKNSKSIPRQRREEILGVLSGFCNYDVHDDNVADAIKDIEAELSVLDGHVGNGVIGKTLVQKISDIDAFVVFWRKHFVDTMSPKFLPSGWKIDNKTKRI
jgi:hypothetical protein